MLDFTPLNTSVIDTFGEPVAFHTPDGDVELQAVPDQGSNFENVGQVGFRDWYTTLMVKTADLQNTGIAARQTVTFRGNTYTLSEPSEELDGMTTFEIRDYASAT